MRTLPSFRAGFYGGLLLAVILGLYLWQLWQADRQVELHSVHFLEAIEQRDWSSVEDFIDATYQDQWGNDRALVVSRMREVLNYTRELRLEQHEVVAFAADGTGEWRARITVSGEENEVMALIRQHINALPEPFRLQWRRGSWKPWDWKLVRVTNPALELPEGASF